MLRVQDAGTHRTAQSRVLVLYAVLTQQACVMPLLAVSCSTLDTNSAVLKTKNKGLLYARDLLETNAIFWAIELVEFIWGSYFLFLWILLNKGNSFTTKQLIYTSRNTHDSATEAGKTCLWVILEAREAREAQATTRKEVSTAHTREHRLFPTFPCNSVNVTETKWGFQILQGFPTLHLHPLVGRESIAGCRQKVW